MLLNPNLELTPGSYRPVIEELDERLNALAGYAQNIDEFTTTNYPAINQNVDNLKNRRTSLKGAVASGERDIKRSYLDDEENNQETVIQTLFIMDNT